MPAQKRPALDFGQGRGVFAFSGPHQVYYSRCMTPLLLNDLLNSVALKAAIDEGYIRVKPHPTKPLRIYNYSEKAAYEQVWTNETSRCRGLIVNAADEIVARPWSKFFNYGEHEAGKGDLQLLDLTAQVEVTDKMDGSLGILYGDEIATRGSFISDQALHATQVYRVRYANRWEPVPGLTYLFEIIFPANRIVLDYGDTDDLVLLGAVKTRTGMTFGPEDLEEWPGPRTITYPYRTLADALAAEPRKNAEGFVVRYPDSGVMVKIKQEDYVLLHRLVTGLNERVVWEHLSEGGGVLDLIESIPDEFHQWVHDKAGALQQRHDDLLSYASGVHQGLILRLGPNHQRRDYAMAAAEFSTVRPFLFLILDGKNPSPNIWRTLKPRADTFMMGYSEDVA